MYVSTNLDDTPTMSGIHSGTNSSSDLYDRNRDFDVLATIGTVCYNTTQDTHGLITATTEDTVTVDGVSWNKNDIYEIYKTAKKGSYISGYRITKILGRQWTNYHTNDSERDLEERIFGPGQPEMNHK